MATTRELRALLGLARALVSSRAARVRFQDTERATTERIVDVLALSFDPPRWVAATWSGERGSLRLLDLGRIHRVLPTRRRPGQVPAAFDPLHFALRTWLDPSAGPPGVATVRLAPPWDRVARALLPGAEVIPDPRAGALLRFRTTRPELVGAFAESLSGTGAIDSTSDPWPKRRRSLTRRASSASPPGSSRRAPRSPAERSTPPSPTTTGGSPTRGSGSSRATRTR